MSLSRPVTQSLSQALEHYVRDQLNHVDRDRKKEEVWKRIEASMPSTNPNRKKEK